MRIASDEGLSGSNGLETRHGLAGALADVEAKRADVLVVMKLDRLARDLVLQETTIGQLRRAGGDVVSITEPEMDGDDHTRDLVRQVLGAISQYERAVIRSRMAAGKAAKAAKGGYVGGAPPLGYQAKDGVLIPDPEEAEVLERIVRLRAGGASYRQVCTALEEAGHRPRRGGSWQPAVVRRIALRAG